MAAVDEHLRAKFDQRAVPSRWSECADALYVPGTRSVADALAVVDHVLKRCPGCLVVVARVSDRCCLAGARDGTRIRMTRAATSMPSVGARECAAVASLLHGQLVLRAPWRRLGAIELRQGSRPPLRLRVVVLV
ncbi:hypothetical protein [Streptomyces sp. NPDC127098]|uniref:hypothetical protein n=1 Tax=Streptomyces sp. NPDC127098 TaxID=3347137 RepID=UPI0036624394